MQTSGTHGPRQLFCVGRAAERQQAGGEAAADRGHRRSGSGSGMQLRDTGMRGPLGYAHETGPAPLPGGHCHERRPRAVQPLLPRGQRPDTRGRAGI